MNEWGIPDWRDAQAYGDTSKWTIYRWRWEFYRRRSDLRECFDAHPTLDYGKMTYVSKPSIRIQQLDPNEPGYSAYIYGCIENFGYVAVPNPRIGEQPEGVIRPIFELPYWGIIDGWNHGNPRNEKINVKSDHTVDVSQSSFQLKSDFGPLGSFSISLSKGQVALIFDLERPLEHQLVRAKKILDRLQMKRHAGKIQQRRRPVKWLEYLRVIDAREDGAIWKDIAKILRGGSKTEQSARDNWLQAIALTNNFDGRNNAQSDLAADGWWSEDEKERYGRKIATLILKREV